MSRPNVLGGRFNRPLRLSTRRALSFEVDISLCPEFCPKYAVVVFPRLGERFQCSFGDVIWDQSQPVVSVLERFGIFRSAVNN